MISSLVSRCSAALLLIGGVALLFAPDVVLPALVPAFPAAASWIGQLLAAAWLGVAALNWLQRRAILGGIHGRPIVFANLVLYFVSALSLSRTLGTGEMPLLLWGIVVATAVLATIYAALLFRGPFDALGNSRRG
jgi:hypothetical protein